MLGMLASLGVLPGHTWALQVRSILLGLASWHGAQRSGRLLLSLCGCPAAAWALGVGMVEPRGGGGWASRHLWASPGTIPMAPGLCPRPPKRTRQVSEGALAAEPRWLPPCPLGGSKRGGPLERQSASPGLPGLPSGHGRPCRWGALEGPRFGTGRPGLAGLAGLARQRSASRLRTHDRHARTHTRTHVAVHAWAGTPAPRGSHGADFRPPPARPAPSGDGGGPGTGRLVTVGWRGPLCGVQPRPVPRR